MRWGGEGRERERDMGYRGGRRDKEEGETCRERAKASESNRSEGTGEGPGREGECPVSTSHA